MNYRFFKSSKAWPKLFFCCIFAMMILPELLIDAHAARRAFVLGNDAYQEVSPLERAANDAWKIGDVLDAIGYEVTREANLRRRDFSVSFSKFVASLEKDDEVVFFYAGHGVAINGENYLLPTDIPNEGPDGETLIKNESFGLSQILEDIQGKQVRLSVLIIDACRNNPFKVKGRRTLGASRGLQAVSAPEGTFIMFSAGVGQQALDSLGQGDEDNNSVFVRKLAPLLAKPGISLPKVARTVRREVNALAAQISHKQTPAYYDEVLGEYYLAGLGEALSVTSEGVKKAIITQPVETAKEKPGIFKTVPWDRSVGFPKVNSVMSLGEDVIITGEIYGGDGTTLDWDGGVARLDRRGKQVWRKNFDMEGTNFVWDTLLLKNGNLGVTGALTPPGHLNTQTWFAQMDLDGSVISSHHYGARETDDSAAKIVQLENGTVALVGWVRNVKALSTAGLVVVTDMEGNELWRRIFAERSDSYAWGATALPDGDLVIAGESGNPQRNVWIARLGSNGQIKWYRHYKNAYKLKQVIYLSSGHLGVVGTTKSKRDASADLWVAKVNLNGTIAYENSFGADGAEEGISIIEGPGGVVVAGQTTSKGVGSTDAWLLELDTWQRIAIRSDKTFGSARGDLVSDIALLPDGGLVIGGTKDDGGGWAFAVSPTAETRRSAFSGNYSGDCLNEKQWTAYSDENEGGFVSAGLNYCEMEESEPLIEFSCGPESKTISVRSDLGVREALNGRSFPVTLRVDRKRFKFTATGSLNEMTGSTEIDFEVPMNSALIEALAAGNRLTVSGDSQRLKLHLRNSSDALERLKSCKPYAQAVAAR